MTRPSIFTVGGTVQAGSGRYIPRKVDEALLALCRTRTFAFVLSARQMGKSSLMVNTAQRLAEEGTRSVIIDLSQIGVQVSPEAWYLSLLTRTEDRLDLDTDAYQWWENHAHMGYAQRLTQFFQEVLLHEITAPVVIFIDEIDSTLSLPFTDDFFAAIRYVYNARASVPAFKRLSFVLIGVATPNDLIGDPRRTPFNIGQEVDLDYFTAEEAMLLAEGFDFPREEARQVLHWILKWTGGHPYLTQRLCAVVAERHPDQVTEGDVDQAVATTFFEEKSEQDSNLRFVHHMLTRWAPDLMAGLTMYQHVWRGRRVLDDGQSLAITHLKLSGIVGRQNGQLRVSNLIYASVFDRRWLKKQWPEHWIKRVPPVTIGLVAALFVAVILLGLFLFQTQRARQAQTQTAFQAQLNAQLTAQAEVSDSLRGVAEAVNAQLSQINTQLSDQAGISDFLRAETETTNALLSAQIDVSDSLNAQLSQINARLSDQAQTSDSLRGTAEERLDEAQAARLETITIALANKAQRQLRLGDAALGALLARQAFLFNQAGAGEFLAPVYDALVQALNALAGTGSGVQGGPEVIADFQGEIRSVAYSPDGRWMAAGSDDGTVGLWTNGTITLKRLQGHTAGVRSLAFSPDASLLASGSNDHTVQVWRNLEQDRPHREQVGRHEGGVWALAFTPDAARLASAGADRTVRIWPVRGPGEGVVLNVAKDARIRTLAFSPDGAVLAFGSEDGTVQLWAWEEPGRQPVVWDSGQERVHALAFHPSGELLVSGGYRPPMRLWRLPEGGARPEPERVLRGHEGPVNAVAFSADGALLASGSADHSVQLWNVDRLDRSPILLQDHTAWVWSVAFSPDGARLSSGSADGSVRIWNIKPERLAAQVCSAVDGRELDAGEWSQFVGADFPYERDYQPCSATAAEQRTSAKNNKGGEQ